MKLFQFLSITSALCLIHPLSSCLSTGGRIRNPLSCGCLLLSVGCHFSRLGRSERTIVIDVDKTALPYCNDHIQLSAFRNVTKAQRYRSELLLVSYQGRACIDMSLCHVPA